MSPSEVSRIFLLGGADCGLARQDDGFIEAFRAYNEGRNDIRFAEQAEGADLVVFVEKYSFKSERYAQQLLQDPVLHSFSDRVYVINTDDIPRGFLPGVYTSLSRRAYDPFWYRTGTYPATYNEYLDNPQLRSRQPTCLFSFCGNLGSHPLRRRMNKVIGDLPDGRVQQANQHFHTHSDEQKSAYAEDLADSFFVLCPRGWSPSTYRLFEAMQMGRCPVILSDDWVPIEGIEWDHCSIRIEERDVRHIPSLLNERRQEAAALGARARAVWEQNFAPRRRYRGYMDKLLSLHHGRRKLISGSVEANAMLLSRWRSHSFRCVNGWKIPQRFLNRVRRSF